VIPIFSILDDLLLSVYDDGLLYDEMLGSKELLV
jgi:hypothetical protein